MTDAALSMDRIYAWQTRIYDFTRKPYLLGRDRLVDALAPPNGGRVLEIGCGTARNLIRCARRWPGASCFGVDVSKAMLQQARIKVARAGLEGRVRLTQADAMDLDPAQAFATVDFQRIYFSYTLSMIPDWTRAVDHAAGLLPPKGALLIADFGDQKGLPRLFGTALRRWLSLFHVQPRDNLEAVLREIAQSRGLAVDFVSLYRGYTFLAALRRP